jgi:hypothetical protein
MATELVFNIEEVVEGLHQITNSNGSRFEVTRSFHYDSEQAWLNGELLDKLTIHANRETWVFGEQVKELADAVLKVSFSLTNKDNHSGLMRLVGALAYRNLDVLAQLEGITHLVRDAGKLQSNAKFDKSSKPLKDHVIHTACDLDAGYRLLDIPDAAGIPLYERLFARMMDGLVEVFPGLDSHRVRALVEDPSIEDQNVEHPEDLRRKRVRRFVADCWIATALLHDVGYLHMLGPRLVKAYEGGRFGPSSWSDRKAGSLYRWFEDVAKLARHFEGGGEPGSQRFCFPPIDEFWGDDGKFELPGDHHGYISGYMLIEALLSDRKLPWRSLGIAERCIAVIAAAACGFHSMDVLWHCDSMLDADGSSLVLEKALLHLGFSGNPVRAHLLKNGVQLDRLIGRIRQSDPSAVRELSEELNHLISVPEEFRARIQDAAKWSLTERSEYQDLLTDGGVVLAEARSLFEKLESSKLPPKRVELLNRFVLEAALGGGIRSSLEQAWAAAWRYNPMGVYLYAVDAIQEWVRLVWKRLDRQIAEKSISDEPAKKRTFDIRIPGSTVLPEGLAGAIGQCPIPEAIIRFGALEESKPGVELGRNGKQLWVAQPMGDYDYDRLAGMPTDVQKRRNLPIAMQLITGYRGLKCSVPTRLNTSSRGHVHELAVRMAEEIRRVAVRRTGGVPDEIVTDGAPFVVAFDSRQSAIIKAIEEDLAREDDSRKEHAMKYFSKHYDVELGKRPPMALTGDLAADTHLDLIRTAFKSALADPGDPKPVDPPSPQAELFDDETEE